MKIKTSELIGPALDWAVAKCEGLKPDEDGCLTVAGDYAIEPYRPTTNWSQGGPIIEREMIATNPSNDWRLGVWIAYYCGPINSNSMYGTTPLIAAMRCYLASKLGDEVEIPEELR